MSCQARICSCAAVSLLLLRVAVGWHFFWEGKKKVHDPTWSSAGFLLQAKGPLAEFYHSKVPQVHSWRTLLAVPPDDATSREQRAVLHEKWEQEYNTRLQEARDAGQPLPFEISPHKPYSTWAQRISEDWQDTRERFFELPDLTDEQRQQAMDVLSQRRAELVEYFEAIEQEIDEFQVQLGRIQYWKDSAATGELPYHDERIVAEESKALRTAQPWVSDVRAMDKAYLQDLRTIYGAAQEPSDEPSNDDQPSSDNAAEEPSDAPNSSAFPPRATNDLEGAPPGPDEDAASDAVDEVPQANTEPADASAEAEDATDAVDEPVADQAEDEPLTLDEVLQDRVQAELDLVDEIVSWSHVGIGACLVVGLFTPLAALGGAVFLAMVISTQPPGVTGAQDTYYQFVEMFGLLVLAATCAGRFFGLDYFFARLFSKSGRSQQ